jgi:hypothetical protein
MADNKQGIIVLSNMLEKYSTRLCWFPIRTEESTWSVNDRFFYESRTFIPLKWGLPMFFVTSFSALLRV